VTGVQTCALPIFVNLPVGCPLIYSQLRVQGFMDAADLGDQTDKLKTVVQADNLLFLMGPNDAVIGVAFLSPEQLETGSIVIGVPELAKGLVVMNPFMFKLSPAEKRAVVNIAATLPDFTKLKFLLGIILKEEPLNAMNGRMFPQLYKTALDTGYEALTQRYGQGFAGERIAAETVGTLDAPHMEDAMAEDIEQVNPKNCFYGVDIRNETWSQVNLIQGRPALYTLSDEWPPVQDLVPPVRKTITLPEGAFLVSFYKGFNINEPQWHDLATAQGRATYANSIKFVSTIIDTIFVMPMSDDTITAIIDAIGSDEIPDNPDIDFEPIGDAFNSNANTWQKIDMIVQELDGQWPQFADFLVKNFPEEDTDTMVNHAQDAFHAFTEILDNTLNLIQEEEWANERVPFFWDLFNAPGKVTYSIFNQNGMLYDESKAPAPTPSFTFSPPLPKFGENVTFDASGSTDARTPSEQLEVRWDISADDVFETDWSTEKTFVYQFSMGGPCNVKLEVRNNVGLVASSIQTVYVQVVDMAGAANHIKFFGNRLPWDTYSLFDMVEVSGCTPGTGPYQYEVFTSSRMDDVELIPGVDLVMIVNDQDQTFYDDLAASLDRFERFALNGGVIYWGACDIGWGMGSMHEAGIDKLPGGVTWVESYDYYNYNVNPDHPVMRGLPDVFWCSYASHESFGDLPPGTTVFTVNQSNRPTLIEYDYGFGHIVATGQPFEAAWAWGVDVYTLGLILPRIVKYVMGIDPSEHEGAALIAAPEYIGMRSTSASK